MVLHAGITVTHRMLGTVMGIVFAGALSAQFLTTVESNASSTASRLEPANTGIQNAGVMAIGSRPASEAADRMASSRWA